MIGQQCPKHIDRQIRTGILELSDRDPWGGGDQCEYLSFLLRCQVKFYLRNVILSLLFCKFL